MRYNYHRLSWLAYHQKLSNNDDPVDGAFKWHCEESVTNICGENTLTKVSLNNRGISVDFFLKANRGKHAHCTCFAFPPVFLIIVYRFIRALFLRNVSDIFMINLH